MDSNNSNSNSNNNSNNNNKQILLEIIGMLIDLSKVFLIQCYVSKNILQCQELLELDVDLDEKV